VCRDVTCAVHRFQASSSRIWRLSISGTDENDELLFRSIHNLYLEQRDCTKSLSHFSSGLPRQCSRTARCLGSIRRPHLALVICSLIPSLALQRQLQGPSVGSDRIQWMRNFFYFPNAESTGYAVSARVKDRSLFFMQG
jgi:hypothetical protein